MPDARETYRIAQKLGQKEVRYCLTRGQNPYPALFSEELPGGDTLLSREDAGLLEIPVARIVGVRNDSRQSAFSAGFMPLLADSTEFAAKWSSLYQAHLEEGIRDPITVYEYRNRYFVEEGNKRVSVLRFTGARHIYAHVTRILPPRDGSREAKQYYEYLEFAHNSGIVDVYFSDEGYFPRLLNAIPRTAGEKWTDEERLAFLAVYQRFVDAFEKSGAVHLGAAPSDAFLAYLEIFGYDALREASEATIIGGLNRLRGEAAVSAGTVQLSLNPTPASQAPLLNKLLPGYSAGVQAAFLFERSPATSPWAAAHNRGRLAMEKALSGKVHTVVYQDVQACGNDEAVMEQAIRDGAEILFAVTPKMIGACVKTAVLHPEVKIYNCSLNMMHPSVRTYYGRMYEAKFLTGAIAGALSPSGNIGYIGDYPIYGAAANINAFARGALMANPNARIQLEWSCLREHDPYKALADNGVTIISGRDLRSLAQDDQSFGLYRQTEDGADILALPMVRWGKMYEKIVNGILLGTWKTDAAKTASGAVNYWWGLSGGVLDVLTSGALPSGTRRLMEVLRNAVSAGTLDPLAPFPENYLTPAERATLVAPTPEAILTLETLDDNVLGRIPTTEELTEEALPMVLFQGLPSLEVPRL